MSGQSGINGGAQMNPPSKAPPAKAAAGASVKTRDSARARDGADIVIFATRRQARCIISHRDAGATADASASRDCRRRTRARQQDASSPARSLPEIGPPATAPGLDWASEARLLRWRAGQQSPAAVTRQATRRALLEPAVAGQGLQRRSKSRNSGHGRG